MKGYKRMLRLVSYIAEWWKRRSCDMGHCHQCRVYRDAHGIGGQCIRCFRIHGYMTHDELRECLSPRR